MIFQQTIEPQHIRELLRTSTAPLHARVDDAFGHLLRAGNEGYRAFLISTAAAVLPLEQALIDSRVSDYLSDWPERSRSHALSLDLNTLSLPIPTPLEVVLRDDEAYVFGVLYVLEGSRLGARVLQRMLAERLSTSERNSMCYLRHGERQQLWTSFLSHLGASPATRLYPQRAVAGAKATFDIFLRAHDRACRSHDQSAHGTTHAVTAFQAAG